MATISPAQLNAALNAFRVEESTCGDLISNTRIFVAPLYDCETVPTIFNLTLDTEVVLADDEISVEITSTPPAGVTQLNLRRGDRLYFDDMSPYIVAADTIVPVTGTTAIPIEAATVVSAVSAVASVFPFAEALTVASASLANNIQKEGTGKTSQGRRLDSVVTSIEPTTSGDLYFSLDDRALWQQGGIFSTMERGGEIYVYQTLANGQFGIAGRALVTTFDSTQDAQAVVTVSYEFSFQSDFRYFRPAQFLETTELTGYNQIRRLFGQTLVAA